jgi:hypothetical protein
MTSFVHTPELIKKIFYDAQYNPKAPYLVSVAHGDTNGVKVWLNDWEFIWADSRKFAKMMWELPDYKGQPILLLGCSMGKTKVGKPNDCFAQHFSNKMGVPVQAATTTMTNPFYGVVDIISEPMISLLVRFNMEPKGRLGRVVTGEFRTFYPGKPLSGGYRNIIEKNIVRYGTIIGASIGVTGLVAQALSFLDNTLPLQYYKVPDKYWEDYTEDELRILQARVEHFHLRYSPAGERTTIMVPGSEYIYPAFEEVSCEEVKGNAKRLWNMYNAFSF